VNPREIGSEEGERMELVQDYICLKEEVGVEPKPRVPDVDGLAQVIWCDETEESEGQARSESSQLQLR
jgi:hypothetical protein